MRTTLVETSRPRDFMYLAMLLAELILPVVSAMKLMKIQHDAVLLRMDNKIGQRRRAFYPSMCLKDSFIFFP